MFSQAQRGPGLLYRGVNGRVEEELFREAGVGPIVRIVRWLVRESPDATLSDAAWNLLAERLRKYQGEENPAISPLKGRRLVESLFNGGSELLENHLTPHDHVFSEHPLQTPSSGRALDSLTRSPTTAILYAYGVVVDKANEWDTPDADYFYRGHPNGHAMVAIMREGSDGVIPVRVFSGAQGAPEAERRSSRDMERLARHLVVVEEFVKLPDFDTADRKGSLDKAAKALVSRSVAIVP